MKIFHTEIKNECNLIPDMRFKPYQCLKTQTSMVKSNKTINISLPEMQVIRSQPKDNGILEQLCLYECDICQRAMGNDALTLEAHFDKIHKSNLAFGCNNCPKRFPKEDLLNQHGLCCSKLYDNIKAEN